MAEAVARVYASLDVEAKFVIYRVFICALCDGLIGLFLLLLDTAGLL